jgi:hypothetical protein
MVVVSECEEFFMTLFLQWAGLAAGSLELNDERLAARHEEYSILPASRP